MGPSSLLGSLLAASLATASPGSAPRSPPAALAPAQAGRTLADEVVAVVDARSIALSELTAEARLRLMQKGQLSRARGPLPRPFLAAALRDLVAQRVVLAEADRLKLYGLDRAELDGALRGLQSHFPSRGDYLAFLRAIDLDEGEVADLVAAQLRVNRYLENRLRLASQPRDADLEAAARPRGGWASLSQAQRQRLREEVASQKYQALLSDLLAELRRRVPVRVVDPLE